MKLLTSTITFNALSITPPGHTEGDGIWALSSHIPERTLEINSGQSFARHRKMARATQMSVHVFCTVAEKLADMAFSELLYYIILFPAVLATKSQLGVLLAGSVGVSRSSVIIRGMD